ncbi:high-affinity lysophosphatidic acid receptor-like [Paramuricea clavata]|uniref:High-affinity lysophosphatidic acid receptor-like n=1 Tax=Paramuricea clavata TaxID=317549 RepID=A0A7D9EMN1_PARCT|nr:high-affinity lysophosphatidic acid receptor-like [Paramuricea clavata]
MAAVSPLFLTIGILLGLTTLTGILANVSVLLVVYWNRSLQTQINMLLVSLAVADLGVAASCVPFAITTVFLQSNGISDNFCQFSGFLNLFFALASTSMMVCISVSQYFAVTSPMKKIMTNTNCFMIVLSGWVISFLIALGPIMRWGRYEFTDTIYDCNAAHTTRILEMSYNITLMVYAFILPFLTMLFTYTAILRAFREHSVRMLQTELIMSTSQSSMNVSVSIETKICFTVVIVVVTFLLCRTPFFIYLFLITMRVISSSDFLGQLAFWAIYLHSATDPFIYAFKHVEYRETLNEIQMNINKTFKSIFVRDDDYTQAIEE